MEIFLPSHKYQTNMYVFTNLLLFSSSVMSNIVTLGISQAETLEWAVISSSRRSSWPRDWTHISTSPSFQEDSLLVLK